MLKDINYKCDDPKILISKKLLIEDIIKQMKNHFEKKFEKKSLK